MSKANGNGALPPTATIEGQKVITLPPSPDDGYVRDYIRQFILGEAIQPPVNGLSGKHYADLQAIYEGYRTKQDPADVWEYVKSQRPELAELVKEPKRNLFKIAPQLVSV